LNSYPRGERDHHFNSRTACLDFREYTCKRTAFPARSDPTGKPRGQPDAAPLPTNKKEKGKRKDKDKERPNIPPPSAPVAAVLPSCRVYREGFGAVLLS